VDPHRLPHRLPQPHRRHLQLVVRFTRDLRRERTFTIDDLPTAADAYGDTAEPDHPADNTV